MLNEGNYLSHRALEKSQLAHLEVLATIHVNIFLYTH